MPPYLSVLVCNSSLNLIFKSLKSVKFMYHQIDLKYSLFSESLIFFFTCESRW